MGQLLHDGVLSMLSVTSALHALEFQHRQRQLHPKADQAAASSAHVLANPVSSAGPKKSGPAMAMRAALVSTTFRAHGSLGSPALDQALPRTASAMTMGAWGDEFQGRM